MPMSISLSQFIFGTMLITENKFIPTITIRYTIGTFRYRVVAIQHYHNMLPIVKKKKTSSRMALQALTKTLIT